MGRGAGTGMAAEGGRGEVGRDWGGPPRELLEAVWGYTYKLQSS